MKGFTLLEVLIGLLLISFGMLGIMALQLSSLHNSQSAYLHGLASSQLESMLDRMRPNLSFTARDHEFTIWTNLNKRLLPQANTNYTCEEENCNVKISWFDRKLQQLQLSSLMSHENN